MPWKNESDYFDTKGNPVRKWSQLRDADGNPVLENPKASIDWFDDFLGDHPYVFLSNYFVGKPFIIEGTSFKSGEQAFHFGKASTNKDRARILKAKTPDEAKTLGRKLAVIRKDWDSFRVRWMREIVESKFSVGRTEAVRLLLTGDALLAEGSLWRDDFWGVDLAQPGRPGENMLGKLLMDQRSWLRSL